MTRARLSIVVSLAETPGKQYSLSWCLEINLSIPDAAALVVEAGTMEAMEDGIMEAMEDGTTTSQVPVPPTTEERREVQRMLLVHTTVMEADTLVEEAGTMEDMGTVEDIPVEALATILATTMGGTMEEAGVREEDASETASVLDLSSVVISTMVINALSLSTMGEISINHALIFVPVLLYNVTEVAGVAYT